jgi:hypothetical protein
MKRTHGHHGILHLLKRRVRGPTPDNSPLVIVTPLRRSAAERERRLRERVARMLWVMVHTIKGPEAS